MGLIQGAAGPDVVLFVYGSLLQGEANHGWLGQARRLGEAWTEPCYTLVSLGPYPALVPGGETRVRGELYAVEAETLRALDELEGHPLFYCRSPVRLDCGVQAEAYVLPESQARGLPSIGSGDWRAFRRIEGAP